VSWPRRIPSWLVGSGVIGIAMALQNLGTYGFTLAAARMLGPGEYGAVAAVMGLMMVLQVVSLGLQATGARQVAAAPEAQPAIERKVLRAAVLAATALGAGTLLLSPLVATLLRLDTVLGAVLLAAATVPLTLVGGQAGILQGERRWGPLAGIYLAVGLGRIGCGVAGMAWRDDLVGAMAGVAVGNVLPALVGRWAVRHPSAPVPGRGAEPTEGPVPTEGSVLREVAHDTHALLAFFALINADVVVARVVLDDHTGGLYAGGLILAKAVLFLPQFVVVLAYPSMAAGRRRMLNQALAVVLGLGAAATAAVLLLAPLAVLFVGGEAYEPLQPRLWAFAVLGTLLALVQLVVYSAVARQHRGAVVVLWVGLLALVAAALPVETVDALLVRVVAVETAVLLLLLLFSDRHLERPSRSPAPPSLP
jgi:O-antigen/teichoic acid export membrane protein